MADCAPSRKGDGLEITFSKPVLTGNEEEYLTEALRSGRIAGDNFFTKKCHAWLERHVGCRKALLTTSGTHALEMAALLAEIQPGDEVIMPSFTFSSTANAFVLRGARIVFVDVRPDTLNLDETLVESAVTGRTRAIVPVHYAGVACEMDTILAMARRHGLVVIEDAAQGVMAGYRGRALGSLGDLGCYSFHETKNYTSGEGGALLVNDPRFAARAEILREKGTNRAQFFRGEVDKYTWLDCGSSYLPSDLIAAVLFSQLEIAERILRDRMRVWRHYHEAFEDLAAEGLVERPVVPPECTHNAHLYALRLADLGERTAFIAFLKERGIHAAFHYVPLHSSPAGLRFGRFHGEDRVTTRESERLVRLPLYCGLDDASLARIVGAARAFLMGKRRRATAPRPSVAVPILGSEPRV